MKKRLLALMMSFVMVVSLVPFSVIPAQATGSEIGIVTASTDDKNIEMHLFNYGPGINSRDTISTEDNDSGFLIFTQSSYLKSSTTTGSGDTATTTWTPVDVEVDGRQTYAGDNCPIMLPYLGEDGYPAVSGYYDKETKDSEGNITGTNVPIYENGMSVKNGSLKYLFDKTQESVPGNNNTTGYPDFNGNTEGDTFAIPERTEIYQSKHYTVSPGNGTKSTGLFQKQGEYYVYDSDNNAAWYNGTNFTLYSQTVVPSYVDNKKPDGTTFSTETTRGNFLPFNQLTSETTANAVFATEEGYTPSDMDADLQLTSKVDLWFGMSTEFNFYMPKDGKVGGDDMVFEFTGDDDVWVYIDGVLILDISGTHGALDGSINFANGVVSYQNSARTVSTTLKNKYQAVYTSLELNPKNKNQMTAQEQKIKDVYEKGFNEDGTFKDYSEHSFDFYYMERGGNISCCKLKFNLDPIPQGNLSVEKVEANLNDVFKGKQTYTFKLTDQSGNAMAGKPYEVMAGTTSVTTGTTDANGRFTLKGGQKAVFTTLTATDDCYVEEVVPANPGYDVDNNRKATTDPQENKTGILDLEPETPQNVVFTNIWNTTDLKIIKGVTVSDSRIQQTDYSNIEYNFNLTLDSLSFSEVNYNESFTLKHAETQTIADVPYGTTFNLTESKPTSPTIYDYNNPSYVLNTGAPEVKNFGTAFTGTVASQEKNTIIVTNSLVPAKANLTVSKTEQGLNYPYAGTPEYTFQITESDGTKLKNQNYKIDEDDYTTDSNGEFTLKGGQSAVFELDVLKEYIVTEIVPEDSSYTANPATAQTVSLKDGTTKKDASVAFTNTWDATGSLDGQTSLRVTKELEGRAWREGDEFTFTLSQGDTVLDTIDIKYNENGNYTKYFEEINYTEADIGKTYTYTVKEKDTSIDGITKDSTVYTVSVKITDAGNNKLDVQPSYGDYSYTEEKGMVFTNTYSATGTLDGDTALKVTKTLTGRDWLETDAFYAQISVKDSKSPIPTGDAVLELTNTDTTKTSVSAAFGDITYTEQDIGTHVYEVEEVYGYLTDYGKISRITYDTTVYTVTVTVTDNYDGTLTVTPTYTSKPGDWWFAQSEPFDYGADGLTFTNRYTKPKPPVDIEDDPPALNTEDHYAYIVGYPDGTVQPEDDITRAEVATIFFRMLTDEARNLYWCQTNDFTDVELDDWYNNAISTLSNAGILDGYPDGAFQPNEPITRAEFTKIAVSFFEYADSDFPNPYSDVKPGAWYYQFVVAANEMGLIEGYPDGTFQPEEDITRAEACTIVNRTLDRHPHEDHLLEDMILWPDNPAPGQEGHAWYYEQVQEATNSHTYEMKTGSETLLHEIWQELLPVRDWPALEKAWSDANSALGGEVMK